MNGPQIVTMSFWVGGRRARVTGGVMVEAEVGVRKKRTERGKVGSL